MPRKHRTKKESFNSNSIKIGKVISKLGISPNGWTFISLLFAIVAAVFIINKNLLVGAIFFLISVIIDVFDGAVARATNRKTKFGSFLDTVVDRYVESLIVFSLLFISLPKLFLPIYVWLFVLLFGSLMTTYIKAAAREKGLVNEDLRGGFLGRSERTAILFLGLIIGSFLPIVLSWIIFILAILTNLAAIQRFVLARKQSNSKK
jgi:phosphatidylglycerophosphate synthase